MSDEKIIFYNDKHEEVFEVIPEHYNSSSREEDLDNCWRKGFVKCKSNNTIGITYEKLYELLEIHIAKGSVYYRIVDDRGLCQLYNYNDFEEMTIKIEINQ